MNRSRSAYAVAIAMVSAVALAACGGGGSAKTAATPSAASTASATSPAAAGSTAATSANASGSTAVQTGSGAQWASDVCGIVDKAALAKTIGTPITAAASPPTRRGVCEYAGTIQGSAATVVRLEYFKDRSEWDIRAGNLGINPKDKLPGMGADAFKSADGIWVLLQDGRMFIADVAYGIPGEPAKELAVTQQVLALSSPEGSAQVAAAPPTAASASSAAAPTAAVDACSLITPAEAETAIGGKVGPAKPGAKGSSCSYTETPFAVDSGVLSITVFANTITYQQLQGQFTNEQPLGVGDEGFLAFMPDTAGANAGFRVGSTVVMINFGAKGPTSAIPAKVKALAAAAAARL